MGEKRVCSLTVVSEFLLPQPIGPGIFPQLEEKPAQVEPGCRVKWFSLFIFLPELSFFC